jgi:tetratricopeptide (TPR) repeat protein
MLGQALIDTSRSAAALALLQPYLDAGAATDHPGVRLLLAEALLNRGKPAEALKLLDAVDLSGVDAQVLEQRAQALADLGRYTQASQVLSKALDHRLASGSADSPAFNSHLIVRARLALAQQQPQGAIDAARSMRLPPGHESPLSPDVLERDVLLAQSALAQKQFAEAAQKAAALRTRIANGPHPALLDEWLQRAESVLGEAQLRAGQAGAAQDCLKHALELSLALRDGQAPALSHSHALLGLARLAGGDQAAAAKHLRAAEDIEAAVGALPPHQAQALRELQSRIPAAVVARTR